MPAFRHISKIGDGWDMTATHTDPASHHSGPMVIACRGARLVADADAERTVMTISGEIDASNVDDLSRHARGLVPDCGDLIVDLADIDIAVDGLRAFALNSQCDRNDITWALIASRAVKRLLRVERTRQGTSRRPMRDRGPIPGSPIRPRHPTMLNQSKEPI